MRTRAFLIVPAVAALAVLGGWRAFDGAQAGGVSFTVDSTTDAVDAAPGDGTCASASGACTLRASVQESNALTGPDTINLPAGTYALSIEGAEEGGGATGDLDVVADLTVSGLSAAGTIIDGGAHDRVLDVGPSGADVELAVTGVTLRNGDALESGGVLNRQTLTLTDSVISENNAAIGGGIVNRGGGILTLDDTDVAMNTAGVGGAILNSGSITMHGGSLTGNEAGDDGGGVVNYGTLIADGSTFAENILGRQRWGLLGERRFHVHQRFHHRQHRLERRRQHRQLRRRVRDALGHGGHRQPGDEPARRRGEFRQQLHGPGARDGRQ